MPEFIPKRIKMAENWGDKLQQARLQRGLKIEEVARRLAIRQEYLIALEEGRPENLPSGLYSKNFLKKYAGFLGLDFQEALSSWQETAIIDDPFSHKKLGRKNMIVLPKIARNLLIIAIIAICFLYLAFYFRRLVLPPKLEIFAPAGNLATSENRLEISGRTEKEAEVKINGEVVLDNQAGYFRQTVNLKQGLNNIVIKAKKKYSQEEAVNRQILVE
jgi:cytoskeletal protein RodZ